MNASLISDRNARTPLSDDLKASILSILKQREYEVDVFELGEDDARPCLGCLLCLTKHPGECVSKDVVAEIIKGSGKYDLTIYLTPILFGHCSSIMKNAKDRGTGSHNWQITIGLGDDDVDEEELSTFIDLTAKHRGSADIVHPGMDRQVDVFVTRSVEDNAVICKALARGA